MTSNLEDIIILLYSHTDYHDVLVACIGRINKYFPSAKLCLCINNKNLIVDACNNVKFNYIHEYDEKLTLYSRIIPLLSIIKENYLIFNMDNNILIDYVDISLLSNSIKTIKQNNIDQLRFSCSGEPFVPDASLVKDNMFRIEKQYYMSVQPAIWKRESILDIATNFKEHQYRCSECSEIQSYVCNKYISFCSLTVNDIKVEHQKTVSKIYPVYHVITYGRWILEDEYSMKVIKNISSEFNINLLKLGVRVGDNSYTMTVEQFLSNPIMVSKYNKFLEM